MKKEVIWILGSYGSGKTTQVKMILDNWAPGAIPVQESGESFAYTRYKKSGGLAILGKMRANQCTGLDSVYSKLGANGVILSLKKALEDDRVNIILMECVFGTFSWYENIVKIGIRDKINLHFVHLEMDLWNNFRRIQQRRANKEGIENWRDIHLADSVYKNAGNKNRETRVVYQKLAGKHSKSAKQLADSIIQIDALLPPKEIHDKINANFLEHCQ